MGAVGVAEAAPPSPSAYSEGLRCSLHRCCWSSEQIPLPLPLAAVGAHGVVVRIGPCAPPGVGELESYEQIQFVLQDP